MTIEDVRPSIPVKQVMTSPVITIKEWEPIIRVAEIMRVNDIGSVVITDERDRPEGMITERDIVTRVVASKLDPNQVRADQAMSSPLRTIDQEADVREAARLMNRGNVKRLGVMYKGKLVGIISSKDILTLTPELLEIIREKARVIERKIYPAEEQPMVGYCELCGQWSDTLEEIDGKSLCEDCSE